MIRVSDTLLLTCIWLLILLYTSSNMVNSKRINLTPADNSTRQLEALCNVLDCACKEAEAEAETGTETVTEATENSRQWDFLCQIGNCPCDSKDTTTAKPVTPPTDCTECKCGMINSIHRIVGGEDTEIHRYPWMATLNYRKRFYCGASLINDRYVVTAAHCLSSFDQKDKSKLTVRLLEHNLTDANVHVIERQVAWFEVHKSYSSSNFDSDIALVRLNESVKITELTHPICLPYDDRDFDGETGIATGWGAICEGCDIAQTLQEVRVPIISLEKCRKSKYGAKRITPNMLCAGVPEGGKDSCQGDSGGPLHIIAPNSEQHHLAGIVSWGWGCARPDYPGVYTRVHRFREWIEQRTRDACSCSSTLTEATVSEETVSEQAVSEQAVNEETVSEQAVSEQTMSEQTTSEQTVNEETASEQGTSEKIVCKHAANE